MDRPRKLQDSFIGTHAETSFVNGKVSSSRPVSAPSRQRNADPASGRKSLGKMGRRPHSAKLPSAVSVDLILTAAVSHHVP